MKASNHESIGILLGLNNTECSQISVYIAAFWWEVVCYCPLKEFMWLLHLSLQANSLHILRYIYLYTSQFVCKILCCIFFEYMSRLVLFFFSIGQLRDETWPKWFKTFCGLRRFRSLLPCFLTGSVLVTSMNSWPLFRLPTER